MGTNSVEKVNYIYPSYKGVTQAQEEYISPQTRVIYAQEPDEFVKPKNEPKEPKNKENDKKMSTGAKIAIGAGIAATVSAAVSVAMMIGRNPAKAAKVLKGTTKYINKAYQEGDEIAQNVIKKDKGLLDSVLSYFKKPKYKCEMSASIEKAEEFLKKQNVSADSEVGKALKTLKANLQSYIQEIEGKELSYMESRNAAKAFAEKNTNELTILDKAFRKYSWDYDEVSKLKLYTSFSPDFADLHLDVASFIKECPKDVLPKDGIFFHGTKKAKGLYKEGFSPFVSNQLGTATREMGAGVYVTPDRHVAAGFSGMRGRIIPVKMAENSKIAYVSEQNYKEITQKINTLIGGSFTKEELEKMPKEKLNAIMECITRRIFIEAGYDAAYVPKAVKGGGGIFNIQALLSPDVNEVLGRNQSQLVIFSPEKAEIVSRSISDRFGDLKVKWQTLKQMIKYQKEHSLGF